MWDSRFIDTDWSYITFTPGGARLSLDAPDRAETESASHAADEVIERAAQAGVAVSDEIRARVREAIERWAVKHSARLAFDPGEPRDDNGKWTAGGGGGGKSKAPRRRMPARGKGTLQDRLKVGVTLDRIPDTEYDELRQMLDSGEAEEVYDDAMGESIYRLTGRGASAAPGGGGGGAKPVASPAAAAASIRDDLEKAGALDLAALHTQYPNLTPDQVNEIVMDLWRTGQGKYNLEPISDMRDFSAGEHGRLPKGANQTFGYLTVRGHPGESSAFRKQNPAWQVGGKAREKREGE